jgi:hypothetical protein
MRNGRTLAGCVLAIVVFGASGAHAMPVTAAAGSSLTFAMNGFHTSAQTPIPGLSALVTFSHFTFEGVSLLGQNLTRVRFAYSLTNDSAAPVTASRVSNIAFNTSPNIFWLAPNSVSGVFDSVRIDANQPNGIGTVEMCFTDRNCPGGDSGGVTQGNTDTGSATLYFSGVISSLTFDSLYVRYQDVACARGVSCPTSASGTVVGVPTPGPLALVGVLAIAGVLARVTARRRATRAAAT